MENSITTRSLSDLGFWEKEKASLIDIEDLTFLMMMSGTIELF